MIYQNSFLKVTHFSHQMCAFASLIILKLCLDLTSNNVHVKIIERNYEPLFKAQSNPIVNMKKVVI